MKFNKKIVVASLSTVMGLSLVGAITGVVAWYQYSTRATASFVGTSVANTGLLQIGHYETNAQSQQEMKWYRDLSGVNLTGSSNENRLTPVTFGAIADGSIPGTAYMQPEAGTKRGDTDAYANWKHATAGKEYLQFDVYLQAKKVANNATGADELVEVPVYLSDITLADVTSGKLASEALRVHIAVDGETTSTFLISKASQTQLPLYGNLDLDGDGEKDIVGGYEWEQGRNALLEYGKNGDTQTTKAISELVVARDENGDITGTDLSTKKILTTKSTGPTKLTITIWLEGWHLYSGNAIWDGTKTANTTVNVGLTFDVGKNAFNTNTL